ARSPWRTVSGTVAPPPSAATAPPTSKPSRTRSARGGQVTRAPGAGSPCGTGGNGPGKARASAPSTSPTPPTAPATRACSTPPATPAKALPGATVCALLLAGRRRGDGDGARPLDGDRHYQ